MTESCTQCRRRGVGCSRCTTALEEARAALPKCSCGVVATLVFVRERFVEDEHEDDGEELEDGEERLRCLGCGSTWEDAAEERTAAQAEGRYVKATVDTSTGALRRALRSVVLADAQRAAELFKAAGKSEPQWLQRMRWTT